MAERPVCLHQGWELKDHHWVKAPPCGRLATKVIQGPPSQRPWYGCGRHAPAMASALSIGSTGDFSATNKDWRPGL